MPAQAPVLAERGAVGVGERELRAQLAVVRVADRRQHRERVDPAGQEDRHEHSVGWRRRPRRPPRGRRSAAAWRRRRTARGRRCAAGTGAGRARAGRHGHARVALGDAPPRRPRRASAACGLEKSSQQWWDISSSGGRGRWRSSCAARSGASAKYRACFYGLSAAALTPLRERERAPAGRARDRRLAPERERPVDRGRRLLRLVVGLARVLLALAQHVRRRSSQRAAPGGGVEPAVVLPARDVRAARTGAGASCPTARSRTRCRRQRPKPRSSPAR